MEGGRMWPTLALALARGWAEQFRCLTQLRIDSLCSHVVIDNGPYTLSPGDRRIRRVAEINEEGFVWFEERVTVDEHRDSPAGLPRCELRQAAASSYFMSSAPWLFLDATDR